VKADIPFLPGTANAADIMLGMDLGLSRFKFFPAEASGGTSALKAIAAPFGSARFCPTGGITLATAPNYLALEAVLCVGGSWMLPKSAFDGSKVDTGAIQALAAAAAALKA
jgi:2-dehydro-3-deoxyphosphogluconate aldolase/(4S)-4-hydroxy-2-oxoglutarate aldolase